MFLQSLTLEQLAERLYPLSQRPRVPPATPVEEAALEKKMRKQALLRARQIYVWFYQRYVESYDEMTDVSKEVRAWLKEHLPIYELKEYVSRQAEDGTYKVLWSLADGKTIESVVIPSALAEDPAEDTDNDDPQTEYTGARTDAGLDSAKWKRLTICISSQVGCTMGCKFCLTGIQGLDRHLEVHEIVSQVRTLRKKAPLTNIVFMGMGEPLHNLDNVSQACLILLDQHGMNFSKRKVTVSTSGLVPAIRELGKRVDVSLAISLNASNDEQRDQIMPVNRRYNLAELIQACRDYPLGAHRRITFEYVMLKDFNDSLDDAKRVAQLLRGVRAKVNLIPFNEHPGSDFKRPPPERVKVFQDYLMRQHLTTTVRISRGRDILAACGQLRSIFGTARGTERHRDYPSSPVTTTQ